MNFRLIQNILGWFAGQNGIISKIKLFDRQRQKTRLNLKFKKTVVDFVMYNTNLFLSSKSVN
jgi:hypothetical protein